VILLLVVAAAYLGSGAGLFSVASNQLAAVIVAPVRTEVVTELVSAPGQIQPRQKVTIYSQVSGRVVQLPVKEGDLVAKGQLLVKLDDRSLRAELESRRASSKESRFRLETEKARLAGLRKELTFAERKYERERELSRRGILALNVLDETERALEQVKAEVAAAEQSVSVGESALAAAGAQVASSERDSEFSRISSPITGTVTNVYVEVGEAVLGMVSNVGTRIMEVADMSQMKLIAQVAEGDIVGVEPGQRAVVYVNAYPGRRFSGRVTDTSRYRSAGNSNRPGGQGGGDGPSNFEVELSVEQGGVQLFPGMSANVDIEVNRHTGIAVDSGAIVSLRRDDLGPDVREKLRLGPDWEQGLFVFVLEHGRAQLRQVAVGRSNLEKTTITSGLQQGDTVVVGPYLALRAIKHNDAVKVREEQRS
jgi:HlyD family secretion protein